ncbi:MAG: AroM family protein [Desulfobacterium sp.]
MGRKMGSLGLLTLGHSPRRDITPSLQSLLGNQVILREAGALDRLGDKEIKDLAPGSEETAIETRLGCGSGVLLSKERLMPHLIRAASDLGNDCCRVVLLCSGKFPRLREACPDIVEPIFILRGVVSKLVGKGTLGIVGPESDMDLAPFQWRDCAARVVCAPASPYGAEAMIAKAASDVAAAGAQIIFLDDMGFTEAHRVLARKISGCPVIGAMTMTARILSELI